MPPAAFDSQDEQAVLSGDPAAFERLVRAHQDRIYNLVCRLVGEEEAEDVAQEVFLKVHRSLPKFRGESKLSTWIYRIAVNVCRDRLRKRSRRPRTVSLDQPLETLDGEFVRMPADPAPEPGEQALSSEFQDQLKLVLAQLSEKHRTVIVLHDMYGLSYEEVAKAVGCSVGTVKSRLYYGREKLRERLRPYLVHALEEGRVSV